MRRLFAVLGVASVSLFAAPAYAPPSRAATQECSDEFLQAKPPAVVLRTVAINTTQLCFAEFAVLHSGVTRTPLWAAEHLTAEDVRAARLTPRDDAFHVEPRLPNAQRADSSDYARSGYDRGHMAPSGDMRNAQAQRESFSLANMAPQAPALNRGLWEEIEDAARRMALSSGEIYIVTGPIFAPNAGKLNNRVLTPAGFFKAIYDPRRKQAGVYVVDNRPGSDYSTISVARLAELTGFDAFPALPDGVKGRVMALPRPIGEAPRAAAEAQPIPGDALSFRY